MRLVRLLVVDRDGMGRGRGLYTSIIDEYYGFCILFGRTRLAVDQKKRLEFEFMRPSGTFKNCNNQCLLYPAQE